MNVQRKSITRIKGAKKRILVMITFLLFPFSRLSSSSLIPQYLGFIFFFVFSSPSFQAMIDPANERQSWHLAASQLGFEAGIVSAQGEAQAQQQNGEK